MIDFRLNFPPPQHIVIDNIYLKDTDQDEVYRITRYVVK